MKLRIIGFCLLIFGLLFAAVTAHAARGGVTRYSDPKPAPDFTLQDLEGNTHALSDYTGKVLILNFWATWCIPCKKEIPSLQRAWEQLQGEGIQLLAVDFGETRQEVEQYLSEIDLKVTYPQGLDPDKTVSDAYWVGVLPTSYVIDPNGQIVLRIIGDYEWDKPEWLQELRAVKGE